MYDYFNVNDNVKLQQKVFVDVMLYFGRRVRKNIHDLKICDFAATTDSDGGLNIYLTKDEQTKNHQDMTQTVHKAGCILEKVISKIINSCIIFIKTLL